ncbi:MULTISPECIES: hypothetical protein [Paenibacillus]|jgi:hypothetical protein|uniref:Uncharacterized protein n=2 Tax=Paenibacillus TaxID=44249 RepID=A0AAJ2N595_9BACL|nr:MULTISPECIES: hypothetical protein [Paenibacillus]GAV12590.1 hypothetical protein PBN151_2523 [Paenibacillus sp. NAIST15-1]MCM3288740.1 hypothetical protein [Paenibacillus sp. MER 180]MCY9528809.1 hypothetical protein [Paenibacillus alvei]MDT8978492.1 hypothetical protein [Paenibacillus sp. chi10]SDG35194.1 hypothetical protein SAMN04488689_11345 [Paenibacillus sp. cl6col]
MMCFCNQMNKVSSPIKVIQSDAKPQSPQGIQMTARKVEAVSAIKPIR